MHGRGRKADYVQGIPTFMPSCLTPRSGTRPNFLHTRNELMMKGRGFSGSLSFSAAPARGRNFAEFPPRNTSRNIERGSGGSVRVTIIHTASLLNLRGSEFWVLEVARLLRDESLSVRVVNFDYARRYPKTPKEIKLRLDVVKEALGREVPLTRLRALSLRLPLSGSWRGTSVESTVDRYLHFLPLSRRFLRSLNDSDVVYYVMSQGNPAYLLVVLGTSILAGWKPVVAGIHVTPRIKASELALLKLAAKAGVLKAVHVVNRSHESELRRIGCEIEYIPNGVRYEKFYSDIETRVQQDHFRIIFVGAMTQTKGADLLPGIYRSMKSQGLEFTLEICTSGGELSESIRDWSKNKPDVLYKGFVQRAELSKQYAQASVAIFPSRKEGFPLACLEVQASGTPVVVADVPGLTQAVIGEVTGIIVPPQDVDSFARAVAKIHSLWKLQRQNYLVMCKKAQENVRDNFQWTGTVTSLCRLLLSVVRDR